VAPGEPVPYGSFLLLRATPGRSERCDRRIATANHEGCVRATTYARNAATTSEVRPVRQGLSSKDATSGERSQAIEDNREILDTLEVRWLYPGGTPS